MTIDRDTIVRDLINSQLTDGATIVSEHTSPKSRKGCRQYDVHVPGVRERAIAVGDDVVKALAKQGWRAERASLRSAGGRGYTVPIHVEVAGARTL